MNLQKTIVLLAMLILIGFFALQKIGTEKEKTIEKAINEKLFPYKFGDVVGFELVNSELTLSLSKNSLGGWQIEKPIRALGEKESASMLIKAVTDLLITRRIPISDNIQIKSFGLNPPAYKLTMNVNANDSILAKHYFFGKAETFKNEDIYAMVEGDSALLLISKRIEDQLKKGLFGFRDKQIVHTEKKRVTNITIHGDETIVLKKSEDTWQVVSPIVTRGNIGSITSLINLITGGITQKFVAENEINLEKYGLDQPKYDIKFIGSNRDSVSLLIGNALPDEATNFYAKESKYNPIFVVNDNIVKAFQKPATHYYDKKVLDFDDKSISSLKIISQLEPSFILKASKDDEKWRVSNTDTLQENHHEKVEQLIRTLRNLSWRVVENTGNFNNDDYGFNKPTVIVEILQNGHIVETLKTGKTLDEDTFVTSKNTGFVVKVSDLNIHSLLRTAKQILGISS